MSIKDEKIMIFAGSREAKMFTDSLAEYTDNIYAVVSEAYGSRQHISGNITVISRKLDAEGIRSWAKRVGIGIIVDGTEVYAREESRVIKEAAQELGTDYFKISSAVDVDFTHTTKCAGAADIVKDASYAVGSVLMIGCRELTQAVVSEKDGALKDRVIALLPPEEESIRLCQEAGYPEENIICMKMPVPEVLLRGIIEGKNVTHMIVAASDIDSIKVNLSTAAAAGIRVSLYGDIPAAEGIPVQGLWKIFTKRFGIREE